MRFFILLIFLTTTAYSQDKPSPWVKGKIIPRWIRREFSSRRLDTDYEIIMKLYPSYLRGDFNGDGRRDYIIQLKEKHSGKSGFVIFHGKRPQALTIPISIL